MNLAIEFASKSIAGVKPQNEDACGVRCPDEPLLTTKGIAAVIADGMSGSDAGKEASEACVSGFLNDYYSTPESWAVKTSSHKILSALNHWLHGTGQREYGSHKGMVTTISTLVFKSNTAYLFHVGDTRIYRLRGNDLQLLTQDHRITVDKGKTYLARAMGIQLHLDIDYKKTSLETDDTFIMLTDGVFEFVTDKEIKNCVLENLADLNHAVNFIIALAEKHNSDDNLTCQIITVKNLPQKNETEFFNTLTKLPFPPTLEPGMKLDGYNVLRHMFSTKRTEVYLVQDMETNRKLILKAPSVNYNDDAEYINQFLHEEWIGRRINNPHVMKVCNMERKRTALYYIAEYIEGMTLRQWIDDLPQSTLTQTRNFIIQIARGLRAFHRLEMIHQDLKPENIIIDEHGSLKIIDFGSTKIAGIEEITKPIESNNILGTINYTAPEYHTGDIGSNRSDIFSLGVIAYELLTGKLPYGKELSARNLGKVSYISARNHSRELPEWVDKALEKAVKITPQYRYGLLSEFTSALTKPDPDLASKPNAPLLERNPLKVWQVISFILFLSNLFFIYLYNSRF
ncbi:MAG: protein kinase [Gammaproteobacteria bacterium]